MTTADAIKWAGPSHPLGHWPLVGHKYVVSFGAGLLSDCVVTILPRFPNFDRLDRYQQHMLVDSDHAVIVADSTGEPQVMFTQYLREMIR